MNVARIEDGFAVVVPCDDRTSIEVQIAERGGGLFELMLCKGSGSAGECDGVSPGDLMRLSDALNRLANSANKWPRSGRGAA